MEATPTSSPWQAAVPMSSAAMEAVPGSSPMEVSPTTFALRLPAPLALPPALAWHFRDLVVPCCQAGGFFCVLCSSSAAAAVGEEPAAPQEEEEEEAAERALLCSPGSAYRHVKAHGSAQRVITEAEWTALFKWLWQLLGQRRYDYLSWPSDYRERQQYPPVADRMTKQGFVCSVCGQGFTRPQAAGRHMREQVKSSNEHAEAAAAAGDSYAQVLILSCRTMPLYKRISVAVSTTDLSQSEREIHKANDQAVMLALAQAQRTAPTPPATSAPLGFTGGSGSDEAGSSNGSARRVNPSPLPSHCIHGASQVTPTGTKTRPRYLTSLKWMADLTDKEAEELQSLSALVQKGDTGDDALIYQSYVVYFTGPVAGVAAGAGPDLVNSVNFTLYKDGSREKNGKTFSTVGEDTEKNYAEDTAQLIVVCKRYYQQVRCKELHSYSDLSIPGIQKLFKELIIALREAVHASTPEREKRKTLMLGKVFLSLIAECILPNPDLPESRADGAVPVALRVSGKSPILVTSLCCSLVRRDQAGFQFASAQGCRDLAVALLFYIKAFILWAIMTGLAPDLFPQPVPNYGGDASIALPLIHLGIMKGHPQATRLIAMITLHNTVMQSVVSTAAAAKQDTEASTRMDKSSELPGYDATQFRGKVIFDESFPLACEETFLTAEAGIMGCLAGDSGDAKFQIHHSLECIDNGKLLSGIVFGGSQAETDQRANLLPWREALCPTAGLNHELVALPRLLATAIYFDVPLGPRASEYCHLLAVPTAGSIERSVMVDASGRVLLRVSSKKNGKSTAFHLSARLGNLVIIYMAYIRPYISHLLQQKAISKQKEWDPGNSCYLFPGLTQDSYRSSITKVFSGVNSSLMQSRIDAGLPTLQPGCLVGIGPQILRQEVHRILFQMSVPDFLSDMDNISKLVKECRPNMREILMQSASFKAFVHCVVVPRMASMYALHSQETAVEWYGRTDETVVLPVYMACGAWLDLYRGQLQRRREEVQKKFPGARAREKGAPVPASSSSHAAANIAVAADTAAAASATAAPAPTSAGATPTAAAAAAAAAATSPTAVASAASVFASAVSAAAPTGPPAAAAHTAAALPRSSTKRLAPESSRTSDQHVLQSPAPKESRHEPPLLVLQQQQQLQQLQQWKGGNDDTLRALCKLVDNTAWNRYGKRYLSEEQRLGVHATAMGYNVLMVTPTGSGKAWLWILYALAFPEKLVVLVLPLVALEDNMYKRLLDAFHGDSSLLFWLNAPPNLDLSHGRHSNVRVVITSPDRVDSGELATFLAGRRVDLVCVDEVHDFMLSAGYRSSFVSIANKLLQLGAPMVCTTATANKREQDVIRRMFFAGKEQQLEEIKQICIRRNICYQVVHHDPKDPTHATGQFARQVKRILEGNTPWGKGQMMIYARTQKTCESLLGVLTLQVGGFTFAVYHGGMNQNDRSSALDLFTKGKVDVLIGTQAVGCGFDHNGVLSVLHYGIAAISPGSFSQQSGRAVRPGSVYLAGLSLTFEVREEYDEYIKTLTTAGPSGGEGLARQLQLESPVEGATKMREYCFLPVGTCRLRWLAKATDEDSNTPTCVEFTRACASVVDLSRCDRCVANADSHASSQLAGLRASQAEVRLEDTGDFLRQLSGIFQPLLDSARACKLCLFCCFRQGGRAVYTGNCGHDAQNSWRRCFKCGDHHRGSTCTVIKDTFPKAGPLCRCYMCMALREGGHTTCDQQFCTLGVVLVALELIPEKSRASMLPPLPEQLLAILRNSDWHHDRNSRLLVVEQLLLRQNPLEAQICLAQQILISIAKGLALVPKA